MEQNKQQLNNQEYSIENRQYKSTLFCKAFADKRYLLDLYNSVNGTSYDNVDDLEVNTIENIVYLSMKNDLSFLIDCNMSLYEHQSTYNPNMPLRGLLYFSQLYNKYIEKNNLNIYSTGLQALPVPQYIVFYNGKKEEPDEKVLLLSEAFQKHHTGKFMHGCLECEARMLNINYGHNLELMQKCKRLEEYAIFVSMVRQYVAEDVTQKETAVEKAVNECIEKGILRDILTEQKAEVLELVLTTFNKELYEQGLKEDAIREGHEEGFAKGHAEGHAEGYAEGRAEGRAEEKLDLIQKKLCKGQTIGQIADALEITPKMVEKLIKENKEC